MGPFGQSAYDLLLSTVSERISIAPSKPEPYKDDQFGRSSQMAIIAVERAATSEILGGGKARCFGDAMVTLEAARSPAEKLSHEMSGVPGEDPFRAGADLGNALFEDDPAFYCLSAICDEFDLKLEF